MLFIATIRITFQKIKYYIIYNKMNKRILLNQQILIVFEPNSDLDALTIVLEVFTTEH